MTESHPAEPLSLRRLRAFLAARAGLPPRPQPARALSRRFTDRPAARRDAAVGDVLPEVLPVPAGPALGEPAAAPVGSPAERLFRSLMAQTGAPATPPPVTPPRPSAEAVPAPRLDRESPPRIPPAGLQQFLADRLGLRLPPVRVHVGPVADRLTTLFRADAVSFGNRIVVRHGRYEPQTPTGAALLGHELTHIAAAATRSEPQTPAAAAREERTALANEHRLLVDAARAAPPVRTAAADRPRPGDPAPGPPPERPLSARQKDELYRELLDRVRTEFERGS
jgi:hypothetical protein